MFCSPFHNFRDCLPNNHLSLPVTDFVCLCCIAVSGQGPAGDWRRPPVLPAERSWLFLGRLIKSDWRFRCKAAAGILLRPNLPRRSSLWAANGRLRSASLSLGTEVRGCVFAAAASLGRCQAEGVVRQVFGRGRTHRVCIGADQGERPAAGIGDPGCVHGQALKSPLLDRQFIRSRPIGRANVHQKTGGGFGRRGDAGIVGPMKNALRVSRAILVRSARRRRAPARPRAAGGCRGQGLRAPQRRSSGRELPDIHGNGIAGQSDFFLRSS